MFQVEWRTEGNGDSEKGRRTRVIFDQEITWESETIYTYPFKFTAPYVPITYHDHHLSIDWYVRSTVEVSLVSGRNVAGPWFYS